MHTRPALAPILAVNLPPFTTLLKVGPAKLTSVATTQSGIVQIRGLFKLVLLMHLCDLRSPVSNFLHFYTQAPSLK